MYFKRCFSHIQDTIILKQSHNTIRITLILIKKQYK
uniref:Uncharacterized protein n=1 Tax=Vertebrata thuyoides TaxID=2006970 RepID=A0A1Z1MBE2_9FLOR|nr:hypothetical protein [Vertebrata thuyoides]ARW63192.1 hypothetical protein [Vertebrata thuyoides]